MACDIFFRDNSPGETPMLDIYLLGRRIAAARELADLTQDELARHASLTQSTIARIEKGRKPGLRVETLLAIARALGSSLDALVGTFDSETSVGISTAPHRRRTVKPQSPE